MPIATTASHVRWVHVYTPNVTPFVEAHETGDIENFLGVSGDFVFVTEDTPTYEVLALLSEAYDFDYDYLSESSVPAELEDGLPVAYIPSGDGTICVVIHIHPTLESYANAVSNVLGSGVTLALPEDPGAVVTHLKILQSGERRVCFINEEIQI